MSVTTETAPLPLTRRPTPQVTTHEVTRPRQTKRWIDWVTTTDHKKIGILYLVTTFVFFALGGIEALLMRTQLGVPNNTLLSGQHYNQLLTMHGTTMIFLFVVPVMAGFGNYFVPLMIGARDMAFPRLNALSYWLLLFGGIVFYATLFWQPPEAGWWSYPPLSSIQYSPSAGQDAWIFLIHITGISSLIGAINFYVTIVNMRAPGMSWGRLPLFIWGILVYAVLLAMIASIVVSIARLATEMPQYANQAQHYVTAATNLLTKFGVGPEQLQSLAGQLNWGKIAQFVGSLLDGITGIATSIVFLLALLLFLSVETSGVAWRLAAVGVRPQVSAALSQFAVATRTYLVVTTVFGLIVAVLDTVALWIIGVPLAITWGLLSFITNYIPNIGFILGLIPPALLGLVSGGWQTALAVIVVYCVLNLIVQSIIQPRFVGDSVGLSVTVTFVALLFGTWLIGPIGAILAIPLTLLAKALLVDVDPAAGFVGAFLRDKPVAQVSERAFEFRAPHEEAV